MKPGHTILISNGSGEIQPYLICKLGNTPIKVETVVGDRKDIIIMNPVTGRIVLKSPTQKCVVVSGLLEINSYTNYRTNGKT